MYGRQDLTRDGKPLRLFPGRGLVLATIEPDLTWPGMWRVRLPNGNLTGKLNLSRATDAAASLALAVLNRHREAACVEVKARAEGFRELYSWLDQRDVLIVKADRQEPLVVVRLSLAAEIAKAATLAAELTAIRIENSERDVKGRTA